MELYLKNGKNLAFRNDLDNYKKALMIDLKIGPAKASCKFKQLVLDTVKWQIELNSSGSWGSNTLILVDSRFGEDGSGSHQARHQLSEIQS